MKLIVAVAFFIMGSTILTAQNTKRTIAANNSCIPAEKVSLTSVENSNEAYAVPSCQSSKDANQQTERKHPSKEEIESQKIAFFTKELDLTPQEAAKFWPIYNESWHARHKARKETMRSLDKLNKALKADPAVSDAEIKALSDTYLENFKKEGDTYVSYFNNFKKVLPLRKAVRVINAEEKFRVVLIRQLRGK